MRNVGFLRLHTVMCVSPVRRAALMPTVAQGGRRTAESLPAVPTPTGALPPSISFGWFVRSSAMLFDVATRLFEQAVRLFFTVVSAGREIAASLRLARVDFGVDDIALSGLDGRAFELEGI